MPIVKCKCGATTNSALSNYWNAIQDNPENPGTFKADGCYAAWDDDKKQYKKGCQFEGADEYKQKMVLDIIEKTRK